MEVFKQKVQWKNSVWIGSSFEDHKLTLKKIVLKYIFMYQVSETFISHELEIASQTVVDWYNFSKEVCTCVLEKHLKKIEGSGKTVEIDES